MFKKLFNLKNVCSLWHNSYYDGLPKTQKKLLYKYVLLLDVVLLLLISIILIKIYLLKIYVEKSHIQQIHINDRMPINAINKKQYPIINGSIFLKSHGAINLLTEVMPVKFSVTVSYPISLLTKNSPPIIKLDNGQIFSNKLIFRSISHKTVYEERDYDGEVNIYYRQNLYPLDTQQIIIKINLENEYSGYMLHINSFVMDTLNIPTYFHDYTLITSNLLAAFKRNILQLNDGQNQNINHYFYVSENIIYMVYSHANISSYFKNMQYLVLSLLMSVFALLINSRKNNPTTGRISAISGSSFALAANLFHVSTLTKQSGGIGLLDLVSSYVATIILLSFLVTVRSTKLNDIYDYESSKAHDILMFKHLLLWTIAFFISFYLVTIA